MPPVTTKQTTLDWNYVIVYGKRTMGICAGMKIALEYCEETVEYAINAARNGCPGIEIQSVTNFIGA